jgi:DNA-binding response OmpR family regulator/HPt (histidine-containing phosphotransfer) domain-containing protein
LPLQMPSAGLMPQILIVDDDPVQIDVVSFLLRRAGFKSLVAFDAVTAIGLFDEQEPDMVILDVGLGETSGLDLLRRFRQQRPGVPILMLTAKNAEDDRVRGLELGADDYLPKPFGHRELLARVRAMLRRAAVTVSAPKAPERMSIGSLALDAATHEASLAGRRLDLTPTEFRLLQCLMARPDAVVPARTLLLEVWGHQDLSARNVLRVTASRLRTKLEDDPSHPVLLVTVPGEGLQLKSAGAVVAHEQIVDATAPEPIVDGTQPDEIAALRRLEADVGSDAFRHVIEVFEKTAPTRVSAMRAALEGKDSAALARQAHTLKGSSAIVGAQRLARVCGDLEQRSRAKQFGRVEELLQQVETELAQFESLIKIVRCPR